MSKSNDNHLPQEDKNDIVQFFHCGQCIDETGGWNGDPYDQQIEVGWTIKGFQVWCRRHNRNIMNLDLMGQKVRNIGHSN